MTRRFYYIITILITIIGIALGFLIMPHDREKAFLHFKDKLFAQAYEEYQTLWESGDRSINVTIPLSNLHLQYGEVGKAIAVMETYIELKPNSVEALKMLAKLYQYDQRNIDYLQTLEKLYQLKPDRKIIIDLSHIYNSNGMYDKQITILNDLIDNYKPQERDFTDLAYLYAQKQQFAKAEEIIDKLLIFYKGKKFEDQTLIFITSILLDNKKYDKALAVAKAYSNGDNDDNVELSFYLIELMINKNAKKQAAILLEPIEEKAEKTPNFLISLTNIQIDLKQEERAFKRLMRFYKKSALPDELLDFFVEQNLEKRNYQIVKDIINQRDITNISPDNFIEIAQIIIKESDQKLAKTAYNKLGEDYLQSNPIVKAMLILAIKDKNYKENFRKYITANLDKIKPDLILTFAGFCVEKNLKQTAFLLLNSLKAENVKESEITAIAAIYLEIEKEKEGLKFINKIKPKQKKSINFKHAKLMLLTALGKLEEVNKWLDSKPKNKVILTDIYFIALDNNHKQTSLKAAKRLYELDKNPQNSYQLAQALTNDKQAAKFYYEKTLEGLEKLDKLDYEEQIMKSNSLINLKRNEEAIIVLYQLLKQNSKDDNIRADLVNLLIDEGRIKEAEEVLHY